MVENPIFIGGLAHSGKTQLRLMLAEHPDVVLTRRTYMWSRFYDSFGDLSQPQNFEQCLTAMLQQKSIQALQPDPDLIRRQFKQGVATYARLFTLFHQQNAQRLGKKRWGDQLGFVERFADVIFAAIPSAKMIHMIRDPRDSFAAGMAVSKHRQGKTGWNMSRWLFSANLTQRNQLYYPGNYKVVRYESLREQPQKVLREICTFLEMHITPQMLATAIALNFSKKQSNSGHKSDIGQPTDAIKKMSQREIAFTQTYAKKNMLAFNYPLQPIQLSLWDKLLFYLIDWPTNRVSMAMWQMFNAKQLARYLQTEQR